jgi:hypothetical protein
LPSLPPTRSLGPHISRRLLKTNGNGAGAPLLSAKTQPLLSRTWWGNWDLTSKHERANAEAFGVTRVRCSLLGARCSILTQNRPCGLCLHKVSSNRAYTRDNTCLPHSNASCTQERGIQYVHRTCSSAYMLMHRLNVYRTTALLSPSLLSPRMHIALHNLFPRLQKVQNKEDVKTMLQNGCCFQPEALQSRRVGNQRQ